MKKYLSFIAYLLFVFYGCSQSTHDNSTTGVDMTSTQSEEADAGLPSMDDGSENITPVISHDPLPEIVSSSTRSESGDMRTGAIAMENIAIDTLSVEEHADASDFTLVKNNPVISGEWTVQPQYSNAKKKTSLKDKKSFTALGMDGFVPMPIGAAGKSFDMTVAPGVFLDQGFVFDWGIIIAGVGGSVNYFSAKNSKETYMLDLPVSLKAEYMLAIEDLYFFGGVKAGATIVNFKTVFDKESQTGLSFYLSPEVGAGYCIAEFLALSVVTSFDMTMFITGDIHMNLNPSLRLMYLF